MILCMPFSEKQVNMFCEKWKLIRGLTAKTSTKPKVNWIQFGIGQRWMNGKTRALKTIQLIIIRHHKFSCGKQRDNQKGLV